MEGNKHTIVLRVDGILAREGKVPMPPELPSWRVPTLGGAQCPDSLLQSGKILGAQASTCGQNPMRSGSEIFSIYQLILKELSFENIILNI